MKVFRQTILLILLLAISVGVYFLILEPKKEKEEIQKEKEKKLTDFSSQKVYEIWIEKKGGEEEKGWEKIGFRRTEKKWDIIHPIWAEADRFSLNPIASRYSSIEIERVIEENPEDLSQYGLAPPRFKVSVKLKDSPSPLTFLIGDKSQVGYSIYLQKVGIPKVFLVSAALESVIDKKLEEFRQKRPMDFIVPDVKKMVIKRGEKTYVFEKRLGGEWWIKFPDTPTFVKASDSRVRDLLYSINGVLVEEFVSDSSPPANLYGLDNPDMIISVITEEEGEKVLYELELKAGKGKKIYARRPGRPNIFTLKIKKDFYAAPLKSAEYRERKVIHFYVWRVREVSVEREETATIVQRDPINTEKWYVVHGEEKKELDSGKVKEALRKLANTQVVDFIADNADITEFISTPRIRVRIDVEGRENPYYLVLGDKKEFNGKKGVVGALEDIKSVFLFPENITEIIREIENLPLAQEKKAEGEKGG